MAFVALKPTQAYSGFYDARVLGSPDLDSWVFMATKSIRIQPETRLIVGYKVGVAPSPKATRGTYVIQTGMEGFAWNTGTLADIVQHANTSIVDADFHVHAESIVDAVLFQAPARDVLDPVTLAVKQQAMHYGDGVIDQVMYGIKSRERARGIPMPACWFRDVQQTETIQLDQVPTTYMRRSTCSLRALPDWTFVVFHRKLPKNRGPLRMHAFVRIFLPSLKT